MVARHDMALSGRVGRAERNPPLITQIQLGPAYKYFRQESAINKETNNAATIKISFKGL